MEKLVISVKRGDYAIYGPLTYQIGTVSAIRKGGFYARFKSSDPRTPGGRNYYYISRFFPFDERLVECDGFPPNGCVKIVHN